MANIGYLNRNENGALVGKIETLAFNNVIGLRPYVSQNPKAPAFDIMAMASDRRTWVKVGAAFEQSSNRTGVVFYQGTIDDPSMANPMNVAFFANDEGGFNIAWTRKRPRRELGSADMEQEPNTDAGDGLGDSTADDAAFLAGASQPKGKRSKAMNEGDPFAPEA